MFHPLNPPIRARYIRFRPVAWHGLISMRVELFGCEGNKELELENPSRMLEYKLQIVL